MRAHFRAIWRLLFICCIVLQLSVYSCRRYQNKNEFKMVTFFAFPLLIAVITAEPEVECSFASKGVQTRRTSQYKQLSLRLCVKPLITVITAIVCWSQSAAT